MSLSHEYFLLIYFRIFKITYLTIKKNKQTTENYSNLKLFLNK
jgi:hypothetical protein